MSVQWTYGRHTLRLTKSDRDSNGGCDLWIVTLSTCLARDCTGPGASAMSRSTAQALVGGAAAHLAASVHPLPSRTQDLVSRRQQCNARLGGGLPQTLDGVAHREVLLRLLGVCSVYGRLAGKSKARGRTRQGGPACVG
jgi:hypothetical protein